MGFRHRSDSAGGGAVAEGGGAEHTYGDFLVWPRRAGTLDQLDRRPVPPADRSHHRSAAQSFRSSRPAPRAATHWAGGVYSVSAAARPCWRELERQQRLQRFIPNRPDALCAIAAPWRGPESAAHRDCAATFGGLNSVTEGGAALAGEPASARRSGGRTGDRSGGAPAALRRPRRSTAQATARFDRARPSPTGCVRAARRAETSVDGRSRGPARSAPLAPMSQVLATVADQLQKLAVVNRHDSVDGGTGGLGPPVCPEAPTWSATGTGKARRPKSCGLPPQ